MDARRPPHEILRRLLTLGVIFAAMATLWACEGDNLFAPGQQADPPVIVSLDAPGEVTVGQTLDVQVEAVGNVALDSIVVRVRGGFSDQQTLEVATRLQATVDASFQVPDEITENTATVSALAFDVQGNRSSAATASITITEAPAQTAVAVGSAAAVRGEILRVNVEEP